MLKKQKVSQEFDKSVQTYLKEIGQYKPLTQKEEFDLWKKYKYGHDKSAKEKLVKSNLKFVANVARCYQGRGLSYSDLIAEGNMGLIRGIEKFDGEKGFKVISYSVWWIKQAIMEALEERNSSEDEDLPDDNLNVDGSDDDAEENEIVTALPFINEDISDNNNPTAKERINFLLSFLTERERFIIESYWGLGGDRPMTLEMIGEEINLTKERVRQIAAKTLTKLRSLSLTFDEKTIY